ncbi:NUMOD4 domain-containing protein [Carnobacterium sp. TMP28]|uniref:NUMOD4 domain-containing protein n=1 Tax=Carnobacterium sp. TMP28 TaxID=3397060 RepID=UPI0039DFC7D2
MENYNKDIEVWKDIQDYEGLYQVSNLGRVKSIERVVCYKNGGSHTVPERIKNKLLKLIKEKKWMRLGHN